jgi:hypothetical protein
MTPWQAGNVLWQSIVGEISQRILMSRCGVAEVPFWVFWVGYTGYGSQSCPSTYTYYRAVQVHKGA